MLRHLVHVSNLNLYVLTWTLYHEFGKLRAQSPFMLSFSGKGAPGASSLNQTSLSSSSHYHNGALVFQLLSYRNCSTTHFQDLQMH